VKLLLDSHALLWALSDDRRLSVKARNAILVASSEILVSVASYYELIFKAHRGRLGAAAKSLPDDVARTDFRELEISKAHLLAAATLDWSHGDPWDRILAAQALSERCLLVSVDEVFDESGVERLW
jgi:PIN domain nuclease of toxin-antitoxin system